MLTDGPLGWMMLLNIKDYEILAIQYVPLQLYGREKYMATVQQEGNCWDDFWAIPRSIIQLYGCPFQQFGSQIVGLLC